MRTEAKVIADSISIEGKRLTTMEVTLHRFVLAEFNTHRVFSRNSASSRAIPVQRQLDNIDAVPALPISHPREQKGMQGGSELEGQDLLDAQDLIRDILMDTTDSIIIYLNRHPDPEHRLHKSVLNRYLEPFMWHTIVVTSTEWDNFFDLRCSPMAQPEIRAAAECMRAAMGISTPVLRDLDNIVLFNYDIAWHLPYITDEERESMFISKLRKISVARCARVSSLHAGDIGDYEKDFRLFDTLTSADPMHASPLEHLAVPCNNETHEHANFQGWHQFRHLIDLHPQLKEQ